MTEQLGTVGFVGLGLMGMAMACNLLEAKAELTVFNRTQSKADPLVANGAIRADSVSDLAEKTRGGTVVICVSDTPAMVETIKQLASGPLTGTLVIDMGTSTVAATQAAAMDIEAAGGSFVDAPVSGGTVGAKAGALSVMAGGSAADIIRAAPVLDVLGKATTHIGPVGAGQIAKAANQAIVGVTLSIVGETMMLAETAGADPAKMREALLGGFAGSRILDLHGQRMIERSFTPGARARTQLKDLVQAVELAHAHGLQLPVLEQSQVLWQAMVDTGMGDLDQSGYLAFVAASQSE